jgi:hypothetical protein
MCWKDDYSTQGRVHRPRQFANSMEKDVYAHRF